jgi:hypothetical protein
MTDEEKIKLVIETRDVFGDPRRLCLLLVDEIKNLRLELEKAKAYDYRSYAPNVWTQTEE